VLDDAFAHGKREVEAAEAGVALFEPGDNAQGMQVVVEAQAILPEGGIESLFTGMSEWRMAYIVCQSEGLGKFRIEAQVYGKGSSDLRNFQRVGEAAAKVIGCSFRRQAGEDLCFAGQAAKCARVEYPCGVAREGSAIKMRRLKIRAANQRVVRRSGDSDSEGQSERRSQRRGLHSIDPQTRRTGLA
jgi:hypothetical protein